MATTKDILKAVGGETATYIDENGERKQGKVLDGYKSAAANAMTSGAGGAPAMTAGGESALRGYVDAAEGADYYGTQADLYGQMLETQRKQTQAETDAATAELLQQTRQQKEDVSTAYGQSDKELFRNYRNAVRDLPQQLAAMGITGGLSESSRVELESGYGENLNKSQLQRMAEIADLDAAAATAQRQNELAAAERENAALLEYYRTLAGLGDQRHQEELTEQRLLDERKYIEEREAAEIERARAEQSAELLASVGDFSGYVSLGLMSEEQAELMKRLWIEENPEAARKLGYTPTPTYYYEDEGAEGNEEAAYAALDVGARTHVDNIMTLLESDPTGIDAYVERMVNGASDNPISTKAREDAYEFIKKYWMS